MHTNTVHTLLVARRDQPESKVNLKCSVEERLSGFPIGARRKWHRRNDRLLRTLGDSEPRIKQFSKLLSKRAMLYTMDTFTVFRKQTRDKE